MTVLSLAALAAPGCASTGADADPTSITYDESLGVDFAQMERTASGLWVEEISEGVGRTASRGDRVRIHYVGRLPDGTVVDSSLGGEPIELELGSDAFIRGLTEGIVGMKVGGQRRLVVRPGLAYGSKGRGRVPPDSVIVFEVQLVDAT